MASENAFVASDDLIFEPISITSYADGHRMLSITGIIVDKTNVQECRDRMDLGTVPGGVENWEKLIDVEIPQLTIWEKLSLDREIHNRTSANLAESMMNFRLHETIPTVDLIDGFRKFQRFYPTFRHVLL